MDVRPAQDRAPHGSLAHLPSQMETRSDPETPDFMRKTRSLRTPESLREKMQMT